MCYALSFLDSDEKRKDLLGEAMDIYYPDTNHGKSGDDDATEPVEKNDTEKVPIQEPEPKESAKPEKKTPKVKSIPESWSVIGSFDSWNKDIAMTKIMDGIWVSPWILCSAGDAFKVRCNGSWDKNLGGTFSEFGKAFKAILNGDNITIPSAGKYIVTLNTKENAIILTKEEGPGEEEKKTSPAKTTAAKKEDKPLPAPKKAENNFKRCSTNAAKGTLT